MHACQLETRTTVAITPSRRVTLHEGPDRGFSWGANTAIRTFPVHGRRRPGHIRSLPWGTPPRPPRRQSWRPPPSSRPSNGEHQVHRRDNARRQRRRRRNYADDAVLMFLGERHVANEARPAHLRTWGRGSAGTERSPPASHRAPVFPSSRQRLRRRSDELTRPLTAHHRVVRYCLTHPELDKQCS